MYKHAKIESQAPTPRGLWEVRAGNASIYVIFCLLVRETERERERAGERGRGRERENLKQAPHLAQISMQGSIP